MLLLLLSCPVPLIKPSPSLYPFILDISKMSDLSVKSSKLLLYVKDKNLSFHLFLLYTIINGLKCK